MSTRDASEGVHSDARREQRDPPPGLWANPNYRIFLAIQTLSALGDSFSYVAIPLLVLHSTGSVVQMGLVTGLTGVASIATGLFAGVIADRVDRRRLLMAADGARCLLYAVIPLVWLFATPMWLIYAVVPLAGVFSMLFRVAYVTLVPAIVEPGQITKANGHLFGTYAVASAGGPMLAGFVASAFNPATAIGIDSVSFAVSAAGILFVRIRERRTPDGPAHAEGVGVRGEFMVGARFLWAHPVLRPLTVLLSLLTFLTYGLTDVIIFRVKEDLGHADSTVGYVLTVGTLGTCLAAFAVDRVRKRLGFGASWIGGFVLGGTAVACLGLSESVPVLGALAALMLFCTAFTGICSMSLRQEVTPSHLLGRVTASFWTIHSALGPLGAAAITAGVAGFGVATVSLAVGVSMVCIALGGALTGVGRATGTEGTGEPGEQAVP
ncbi:MFS transporter [Streptomyces sp. NPDC048441]|uniref:MFS transporter n=1 Tax=Streptomyces sp. NPDC048441 TaxID=3365552 RepID=UPI00370FF151